MSESNNNIPMRITQLEEAMEYPENSYIPIAKAGWGTKKIFSGNPNLSDDIVSKDIYGAPFRIPKVLNGTPPNPGNANAVRTEAIEIIENDTAEICINRSLTEGHYYAISYYINRSGGRNPINISAEKNRFKVVAPQYSQDIQFGVFEYDENDNEVTLRDNDFELGQIYIKVYRGDSIVEDVTEALSNSTKAIMSVSQVSITPTLSDGSGGNPGNVNAVTARAVPTNNAYNITFKNNRALESGHYYKNDVSMFRNGSFVRNKITNIVGNEFSFNVIDITKDNANIDGFGVTIWEYDSSDNVVSIRITDFEDGDIFIRYNYILAEEENNIINRNKDIRNVVDASCYYGHNGNSKANVNKQFAILVTTDVHGDFIRFESAIDYLNEIEPINSGICLGDMAASNFSSPYQWYLDAVQNSKKQWLTVIGNHDGGNSDDPSISATVGQEFSRWIQPTLNKIGDDTISKTYYAVANSTFKIKIIVLNVHDVPDTIDSNTGKYTVSRGAATVLSQGQVDWLISELASIPSDYTLLIALHYLPNEITIDSGVWTNPTATDPTSGVTVYNGLVSELVNAWINGEALSKSYHTDGGSFAEVLPQLNVFADFTSRGSGIFAGYIAGHTHQDMIGHCTNFPDQKYYCFDTTANDNSQNYWSDLPRTIGTKEEDCITVVSVDTSTKTVRLVRVGSNFTTGMTEREFIKVNYDSNIQG